MNSPRYPHRRRIAPCFDHHVLISVEHDATWLLADPLGAQIVAVLASDPACVCHLVEDTGARQPNVSNHLRAQRQGGPGGGGAARPVHVLPAGAEALEAAAAQLSALAAQARNTAQDRRECE